MYLIANNTVELRNLVQMAMGKKLNHVVLIINMLTVIINLNNMVYWTINNYSKSDRLEGKIRVSLIYQNKHSNG